MDFTKQEMQAIESAASKNDDFLLELNELELAHVGGGSGAVSLG
jgi:hypothetical protein